MSLVSTSQVCQRKAYMNEPPLGEKATGMMVSLLYSLLRDIFPQLLTPGQGSATVAPLKTAECHTLSPFFFYIYIF